MNLSIVSAALKGVEVAYAVSAKDHSLTVDHELLAPILQRGFDGPWIAFRRIVAAAGDQPDALTVALQADAEAVVFYFVKPLRREGYNLARGRQAKLKSKHAGKIGISAGYCDSLNGPGPMRWTEAVTLGQVSSGGAFGGLSRHGADASWFL